MPSRSPASYEELFRQRGHSYHRAMQAFPAARREEFRAAVQRAGLHGRMRVADVPAGGNYLQAWLPEGCESWGHEPCATFTHGQHAPVRDLLPLPWGANSMDAVLSIAGVHHLADKVPLFAAFRHICRPGGRLVVADVWRDSAVAHFLDDYVGRHNSTGHAGIFLDASSPADLQQAGWQDIRCERVPLRWYFADAMGLATFCTLLFDIRHQSSDQVLAAVERHLGIGEQDGELYMHWELACLQGRLAEDSP